MTLCNRRIRLQFVPMQSDQQRPREKRSVIQRLPLHTYDQDPVTILAQETWLRDELRERCCLCRQWTARRGGTKMHLQALHTSEWEQTAELARAKCLQYHHLVSHTSGCSFCLEPKFADKRAAMAHAQNCQVLFQFMMLTIMREEEVGLPDGLGLAIATLPTGQSLLAAPNNRNLTSAQCTTTLLSIALSASSTCLIPSPSSSTYGASALKYRLRKRRYFHTASYLLGLRKVNACYVTER